MKVIDIIKSDSTKFTFEIVPPMKGASLSDIGKTIETLLPYNPAYINVTSHRAEHILVEEQPGMFRKRVVTKRPGTVGVAASIKFRYGVEVVPHLICGGFSKEETEDALFDLEFLGIQNVLALRGDAPKGERDFKPETDGHAHAIDLVRQINDVNEGRYLVPYTNAKGSDFSIGVAGYPEKHCEAPNSFSDLQYLKAKVDAGADYIVTQMFYDNERFFKFVKDCRDIGIQVPIIPGLKPISLLSNINNLPQIFHIDLPLDLSTALSRCQSNDEVKELGIEWAIHQCQELKKAGVPALHFFTLGSTAQSIAQIVKTVL